MFWYFGAYTSKDVKTSTITLSSSFSDFCCHVRNPGLVTSGMNDHAEDRDAQPTGPTTSNVSEATRGHLGLVEWPECIAPCMTTGENSI